ncbi:ring-cleaving dioxygenase [Paenibacillus sp. Marseille-Q4541]|uniref:ring-cleaving dioxygenase n=1 Tax=Paenibacillus sp. Marseille-Q4541 TaxID=2831522 RepID=UPI001BACDFB4|nr:ring-cleaving dioxygenase [Paenibacillus sp. Marseille-Q4541]
MLRTAGIHHITAFVDDAQKNIDFYAGVLGLRLVKKTINFDAPEVYHLYFGDEKGSPGTIITFFPQAGARKGVVGGGQTGVTVYAIPPGTTPFWKERLTSFGVHFEEKHRFGETYLRFLDNAGLVLELVEREEGPLNTWSYNGVTAEEAIKGFGGAVLYSMAPEQTMAVMENILGMTKAAEEHDFVRYQGTGDLGNMIDINRKVIAQGRGGAGTVHHIAWRAKDYEEHELLQKRAELAGMHPTSVIDRQYFNAVYFREPGGILFEIATDPPGFAKDEPQEKLGETLMLPSWYEPHRELIEQNLPNVTVREFKGGAKI